MVSAVAPFVLHGDVVAIESEADEIGACVREHVRLRRLTTNRHRSNTIAQP
jgi:hypothetical protein